jgi:hypothetical protein
MICTILRDWVFYVTLIPVVVLALLLMIGGHDKQSLPVMPTTPTAEVGGNL